MIFKEVKKSITKEKKIKRDVVHEIAQQFWTVLDRFFLSLILFVDA
jgi:hypothetical protein